MEVFTVEEQPMDPVLVAFTTKNGSTAEVADVVARTLRSQGWAVELVPITDRPDVAGRSLVVVGAPIYNGRWDRRARVFLKRHRSRIASVPVAVFGMGPREATEEAFERSRAQLDRALAKLRWLQPIAVTVFGGVDPPKKHPRRDVRDWDAIDAWCAELAASVRAPVAGTD